MSISVINNGSIRNRTARPLNGKEIAEAVETHLITLTDKLLNAQDLLSDDILKLTEQLKLDIRREVKKQVRLSKINLTYPKVGWNIKTRLEQLPDDVFAVNAEVELDLERNVRLNLQFGDSGRGVVMASLEEEKIPNAQPDSDRTNFGIPVKADYLKADGTIGQVDVTELRRERRAARVVDVGSGANNREVRELPTYDDKGLIATEEVLMVGAENGQVIVTPAELPEITLDDVIATPPQLTTPPLEVPMEPKGVGTYGRPNAKFKK